MSNPTVMKNTASDPTFSDKSSLNPGKVKKNAGSSGDEIEEDNREMNRRSPNGFLLPDPIPRGERLHDSVKVG